jgi:hypothetical protein
VLSIKIPNGPLPSHANTSDWFHNSEFALRGIQSLLTGPVSDTGSTTFTWWTLENGSGIYHLIQQYHSWGYTQKTVTPEAPAHPCLLQHYSQ